MADQHITLTPDPTGLAGIFSEISSIPKNGYTIQIILNSFDYCTSRLSFDSTPRPTFPPDLFIRLKTAPGDLLAVAELQGLAHVQIPEPVPVTLAVGTAVNSQGKKPDYSVIPFLTDTVVLEDV
ncbi:hypothetical protein B0T18DRAFT_123924 [Schizothecium vesticola]|uniref:Uncharacterized protein n=1 Tax=Schizothecium vesticola TaxID=314040 RepID=A0AA40F355_9PEZI|nr:hypothetical protein B0T18DRAFT_123924 [Schizothecium vesticola]